MKLLHVYNEGYFCKGVGKGQCMSGRGGGGGSCPSIFYFYNKLLSFFCRERIETACDLASDEESVFCMLIPDWATNNLVIIIVQVSILNQAMQ